MANVFIRDETKELIKKLSEEEGVSASRMIDLCVEQYCQWKVEALNLNLPFPAYDETQKLNVITAPERQLPAHISSKKAADRIKREHARNEYKRARGWD